jgi:hypothetical protein
MGAGSGWLTPFSGSALLNISVLGPPALNVLNANSHLGVFGSWRENGFLLLWRYKINP